MATAHGLRLASVVDGVWDIKQWRVYAEFTAGVALARQPIVDNGRGDIQRRKVIGLELLPR